MPRMGQSMEEGTLLRWLKKIGDRVEKGESLAEIETDKSTVEVEALTSGNLLELRTEEGTTVPIGTVIAVLDDGLPADPAHEPVARGDSAVAEGRVEASPIARRIAREHGIDLRALTGTGPGGLIVKADVLAGLDTPDRAASADRLSSVRSAVARRTAESRSAVPDFSVAMDVEVSAAVTLKEALATEGSRVTLNDIIVKAASIALRDFPRLNATFASGAIAMREEVDCAIAVATAQGLLAPVVRSVGSLPLPVLAERTHDLVERARRGAVRPEELEGGSFTVSNLGMYGVRSFEPIVNIPQTAILAVGAIRTEARFDDAGRVFPVRLLTVTCVADHRVTDGEEVARFLAHLAAVFGKAEDLR